LALLCCTNNSKKFGGQEFIAGYIIRKMKNKFPELLLKEQATGEFRDGWTRSVSEGPFLQFIFLISSENGKNISWYTMEKILPGIGSAR